MLFLLFGIICVRMGVRILVFVYLPLFLAVGLLVWLMALSQGLGVLVVLPVLIVFLVGGFCVCLLAHYSKSMQKIQISAL